MDVSPPWYADWSRARCASDTIRCAGGDQVCSGAAERSGYVRISNYELCRASDVKQEPGTTGYGAIVLGLLLVFAAGFFWSRWSRTKKLGEIETEAR